MSRTACRATSSATPRACGRCCSISSATRSSSPSAAASPSSSSAARKPDEIRFLVRDTGIGIAPEQQDRIFLEFEQADSGAARKFGGTGLGLAISKRIVERMGGRIGVDSTPGAGSTFHVTLPLRARGRRAGSGLRAARPRRHRRADRRADHDRGLAGGAPSHALGCPDLRRARRADCAARAAGAGLGRGSGRPCARPRRLRAAGTRHRGYRAAHRADHAGRAPRAPGAQGRRLHRLSGQAGARRSRSRRGWPTRHDAFERAVGEADASEAADATATAASGLAILVAEDNEINALLTRGAAHAARPSSDRRSTRRSGTGGVAQRRRGRRAVRSRADGRAHAGQRRHRGGTRASARPRPSAASGACRSSRSPPMRSTKTARPASPPAWTAS